MQCKQFVNFFLKLDCLQSIILHFNLQIQLKTSNMSQEKSKKAFLKKGARPFLSNATVRSLSQKPMIVDFTQQSDQAFNSPFINPPKNDKKDDLVINVKPRNLSRQKPHSTSNHSKQNLKRNNNLVQNNKTNSQSNKFEQNYQVTNNTVSNSSATKAIQKKPTLLTDYLNSDSKGQKKTPLNSISVPKQNQNTFVRSQAQQLQMQNLDEDSDKNSIQAQDNESNHESNQFLSKGNKNKKNVQQTNNFQISSKKKPNLLHQTLQTRKQKQKITNQPENYQQNQNQVRFESDSDDELKYKKNHIKPKNNQKPDKNRLQGPNNQSQDNNNPDDNDQDTQINRKATVKIAAKPQSKVTQMFNKNPDRKSNSQPMEVDSDKALQKTKKMTIDDVPKQMMEQIVQKYFRQAKLKYEKKQQNLFEQVKVVQKKQQSLNQQQKTFEKQMKQLQKQMEQKNKQFQNKIKSQQNKITRQKMYLKDQQTTGKVDWKTKNQVQQLKQQLQDQRNEKKRIQVKLKGELDRLKARYNQEIQSKIILENRIRQYELKGLKQKQIRNKQEKKMKMEIIQKKKSFWDDSPKQSYLERLYSIDFSLSEYVMEDYFYQNNEFYHYYKEKGETDILQAQQVEGSKIKRMYQNGKIQIESIQKFVKEVFPWGLTIVHYINGDIKQVIQLANSKEQNNPKRLQIYYAKNNQIIQYSISDGKRIHYFLREDQIQLNDELVQLKQVYNGKQLQRVSQGRSVVLQRNTKGKFIEMY